MKGAVYGGVCCCWSIMLISLTQAVPVSWGSGDPSDGQIPKPPINNQVCIFENEVYSAGESHPSNNPCETCICQPPGFTCSLKTCNPRPGCKALHTAGQCCPDYICDCHRNGKTYANGEKVEEPNPCNVCYCRGGEIECAGVTCYTRSDCEPHYVPGKCCPKYDHCPAIEIQSPVSRPSTESSLSPTTRLQLPVVSPTNETLKPELITDSSVGEAASDPEKDKTGMADSTNPKTTPMFEKLNIPEPTNEIPSSGTLEVVEIYPQYNPSASDFETRIFPYESTTDITNLQSSSTVVVSTEILATSSSTITDEIDLAKELLETDIGTSPMLNSTVLEQTATELIEIIEGLLGNETESTYVETAEGNNNATSVTSTSASSNMNSSIDENGEVTAFLEYAFTNATDIAPDVVLEYAGGREEPEILLSGNDTADGVICSNCTFRNDEYQTTEINEFEHSTEYPNETNVGTTENVETRFEMPDEDNKSHLEFDVNDRRQSTTTEIEYEDSLNATDANASFVGSQAGDLASVNSSVEDITKDTSGMDTPVMTPLSKETLINEDAQATETSDSLSAEGVLEEVTLKAPQIIIELPLTEGIDTANYTTDLYPDETTYGITSIDVEWSTTEGLTLNSTGDIFDNNTSIIENIATSDATKDIAAELNTEKTPEEIIPAIIDEASSTLELPGELEVDEQSLLENDNTTTEVNDTVQNEMIIGNSSHNGNTSGLLKIENQTFDAENGSVQITMAELDDTNKTLSHSKVKDESLNLMSEHTSRPDYSSNSSTTENHVIKILPKESSLEVTTENTASGNSLSGTDNVAEMKYLDPEDIEWFNVSTPAQLSSPATTEIAVTTIPGVSNVQFSSTTDYEIVENSTIAPDSDSSREYTIKNIDGYYPKGETPEKLLNDNSFSSSTTEMSSTTQLTKEAVPKKPGETTLTLAEILLKWLESKKAKAEEERRHNSSSGGEVTNHYQTTKEARVDDVLTALTAELVKLISETTDATYDSVKMDVPEEEKRTDVTSTSREGNTRSLDADSEKSVNIAVPHAVNATVMEEGIDIYNKDIENLAEALGKPADGHEFIEESDIPIHLKYPFTDESLAPVLSMISDQLPFLKLGEEQPLYIEPPPDEFQEEADPKHGVMVVPTSAPITVHMVKVVDGGKTRQEDRQETIEITTPKTIINNSPIEDPTER